MKTCTLFLLLTIAAFLLLATGAALAQSGPAIDWWVSAGGGGTATTGNVRIDDTIGQPVVGGSASGSTSLNAGYWQERFAPDAVLDLTAAIDTAPTPDLLRLNWTGSDNPAITYNIYRALNAPYFAAEPATLYPPGADWPAPPFSDPQDSVLTTVGQGTYYVVAAVYGGVESELSNRVGAFVFALVKGS